MDEDEDKTFSEEYTYKQITITILLRLIPFLKRIEKDLRELREIWICRSSIRTSETMTTEASTTTRDSGITQNHPKSASK